jgi:hypothetical protein
MSTRMSRGKESKDRVQDTSDGDEEDSLLLFIRLRLVLNYWLYHFLVHIHFSRIRVFLIFTKACLLIGWVVSYDSTRWIAPSQSLGIHIVVSGVLKNHEFPNEPSSRCI